MQETEIIHTIGIYDLGQLGDNFGGWSLKVKRNGFVKSSSPEALTATLVLSANQDTTSLSTEHDNVPLLARGIEFSPITYEKVGGKEKFLEIKVRDLDNKEIKDTDDQERIWRIKIEEILFAILKGGLLQHINAHNQAMTPQDFFKIPILQENDNGSHQTDPKNLIIWIPAHSEDHTIEIEELSSILQTLWLAVSEFPWINQGLKDLVDDLRTAILQDIFVIDDEQKSYTAIAKYYHCLVLIALQYFKEESKINKLNEQRKEELLQIIADYSKTTTDREIVDLQNWAKNMRKIAILQTRLENAGHLHKISSRYRIKKLKEKTPKLVKIPTDWYTRFIDSSSQTHASQSARPPTLVITLEEINNHGTRHPARITQAPTTVTPIIIEHADILAEHPVGSGVPTNGAEPLTLRITKEDV